MPTAVNTPAAGVCAPASKFTTERAKPPLTGKPPVIAADRLLAPRATSSWSGSMRWRRLAARVWPTDTDSTKPTTLISSAGTASARHSSRSHSGRVSGGRPWGTLPTTFRPCAGQSSAQARVADTAMAATGPALASASAVRARRPRRSKLGLSPLRVQNKKPVAAAPTARVSPWVCGSCCTSAATSSTKLWPSALTPSKTLSWLAAINRPEAEIKPEITGWLKKLAKKPRRSTPISSSIAPDIKARVMAMAQ